MEGGSFTITNLGGIGGTAFSPIVNTPEVAILGVSRGRESSRCGAATAFVPRLMLPLSPVSTTTASSTAPMPSGSFAGSPRPSSSRSCCRWKASAATTHGTCDSSHAIHQVRHRRRGPGGYAAAFLAADLGLDVTLVGEDANPGGVCLYRGCIPSKALLHVGELVGEARHASAWGVDFGEPKIDLAKLRGWKESVVQKLTGGLGQLARQRKVGTSGAARRCRDRPAGHRPGGRRRREELTFETGILATGSRPATIPGLSIDSPRLMDSTTALEILTCRRRCWSSAAGTSVSNSAASTRRSAARSRSSR